jgi:hypothetical protein
MDRKLSDEQIESLAERLLRDFAPEAETLDEIAESPRLWWSVRSRIEAEKARRPRGWSAFLRLPLPAFAGLLAVLICLGAAITLFQTKIDSNSSLARRDSLSNSAEAVTETHEILPDAAPENDSINRAVGQSRPLPGRVAEKKSIKNAAPKNKTSAKNRIGETSAAQISVAQTFVAPRKEISPTAATGETKTDFIALSYAANTDSGQIVRVKVPGSMMVSLGLKTNVEKESEMVSAEVIVGDDGLARAIRFIR